MLLKPYDRCAVFVDGANNHAAVRDLDIAVDYARVRRLFAQRAMLVRCLYYTALPDQQEHSPVKPLVDWLGYNGWQVVTKRTKEYTDPEGRRRIKGDMDVEIAIDVMEMAENLDQVVIFSGDGDFARLVEHVKRMGVRTMAVSTLNTGPPMIADELRRAVDEFVDLEDIRDQIARAPRRAA